MRVLNFADGFGSSSEPALGTITANNLFQFANDAAFVAYKTEPAVAGDVYWNTTLNHARWFDGTNWVSGVVQDDDGNVVIPGNLTVQGTTTTIDTENLVVTDQNIQINNGGNDASAEGAGLTVQRTTVDGKLAYDSTLASKWKAGNEGATSEVLTAEHAQTVENKTIDADENTLTNISNDEIKSGANIAHNKMAPLTASKAAVTDGSGVVTTSATTATELGYLSGTTSNVQTQISTNSSAISSHVSNATGAHAASAISNTPTGNLAATDVQGALNELQTEIDALPAAAKVFTNKDIDGGTASNTRRITIPKDTKTNLDSLTRKAGTVVYATDEEKLYFDNGTTLQPVGSGSGAAASFLENHDAELGTANCVPYADAAGTSAVDGTGGSPTVSVTDFAFDSLNGENSFNLVKPASNCQGQGWSWDFEIPQSCQARMIDVLFDYRPWSGTFTAATNSADSDVIVQIYDRSNGTLITSLSSKKLWSNSSALADKFEAQFQTAYNSTQYRLILHVQSTTTNAFAIEVDDIIIRESQYRYTTPISDWTTYTPALAGITALNTGSLYLAPSGRYRRIGDTVEIQVGFRNGTGAAASGSSYAGFYLPSGITADTTKLIDSTSGHRIDGQGSFNSLTSKAVLSGNIIYVWKEGVDYYQVSDITAGSSLIAKVSFPVQGWSSSLQLSESKGGPAVLVSAKRTGALSVTTTPSTLAWDTAEYNALGLFSTSTGEFTAHRKMDVLVQATALVVSTGQGVYLNVVAKSSGGAYTTRTSGVALGNRVHVSKVLSLNAGDMVKTEIYVASSTTSLDVSSSGLFNQIAITEITPSNQAFAAQDNIFGFYSGAPPTGTLNGSFNTTTYGTKRDDSHGAYSGGELTVPYSGVYSFAAAAEIVCATNTVGNRDFIGIFIDGTALVTQAQPAVVTTNSLSSLSVSAHGVRLNQGQKVTIKTAAGGTTPTYQLVATRNFFSWARIGL